MFCSPLNGKSRFNISSLIKGLNKISFYVRKVFRWENIISILYPRDYRKKYKETFGGGDVGHKYIDQMTYFVIKKCIFSGTFKFTCSDSCRTVQNAVDDHGKIWSSQLCMWKILCHLEKLKIGDTGIRARVKRTTTAYANHYTISPFINNCMNKLVLQ